MKIFITGGSGFVGKHLTDMLLSKGHQVIATGTRPQKNIPKPELENEKKSELGNEKQAGNEKKQLENEKNFSYIQTDTTQKGDWQEALQDVDAVVNLAGKTIFRRWNEKYKKQIYDSRILTTRHVTEGLPKGKNITFCSTSAAGYYGNRGDDFLTEDNSSGDGFLAKVCKDWEAEAFQAEEKGVRVVAARFGVVLGKNGGAMKQMIPAFRFGVGGPLGSGTQWFPWIHMDDLLSAILFVLENEKMTGPVNFVAPNPIRNSELARTLGQILKRPAFIPAPAFMLRLVMGEMGENLLASQRVIPEKLLRYGFDFKYETIQQAVENIVKE